MNKGMVQTFKGISKDSLVAGYPILPDLNAASIADFQKFYDTYYVPNNATLVITGDIDKKTAKKYIKKICKEDVIHLMDERPDFKNFITEK